MGALSRQISSHMESMKGNLAQVHGVLPALAEGKATLQSVLQRQLDHTQYEKVLLG
jgi:hypothetical protein